MKIAVSVESTHDLSSELLTRYDISVIPYHITLGDKTFKDGEMSTDEMFKFVKKNGILPKTNAINEFGYTEYFEGLRKEYDAVIHITLSSGLTSSHDNAVRASKNVSEVYVVDSLSLSAGIGLLAIYARELLDGGLDVNTVYKKVTDRVPALQTSFVVEKLDFLHKGGRCSSLELLGANVLKIRPSLILKDGEIKSDKKYRGGMGRVIEQYARDTLATYNTPDLKRAFIAYTTATDEMLGNAVQALKDAGFNEVIPTFARGTVASHCGENTLGIIYFNDGV